MNTQGAIDVPSNLPVSAPSGGIDLIYAPCSGIWDGNEKGWTVVQYRKRKSKKSM